MNRPAKIGLLIGAESDWPAAFINEVARRRRGVSVELIKLSGTHLAETSDYAVIIDRISHEIPYYHTVLKVALLNGTAIINNPLEYGAHDRFFNASLVSHMGFYHPRTVALPSHAYNEGVFEDSLRNLIYPIPWEKHITYLGGFPVVLRPLHDSVLKRVYIINNYQELWHAYNQTGTEPMMLREHITWDKYVRCICIGPHAIKIARYVPGAPSDIRYYQDETYLNPRERALVSESAQLINRALGLDFNMLDFAFQGSSLIAVDVTNPTPRLDINQLTPFFFDWVVATMADYAIALALGEQRQQMRELIWHHYLKAQQDTPHDTHDLNGSALR
ncbi:MAG: hypothetical protein HC876_11595 [Chloroflexaceae bacterium]|nr:hypothetical protein [Chloroflexaceae bacterium]NJO06106.1 hypothetical protein [Chloroflexaceae bacterium]